MNKIDFIEKHAGVVEEWRHAGGVHVRLPEQSFFRTNFRFLGLNSEQLREHIDEAMKIAITCYQNNVSKMAGVIDPELIEEAALEVVLHTIQVHNEWRRGSWLFKSRKPLVSNKDLQQVSAQDQIFFLCQKRFGENYALAAATLLGMTTGEFVAWEAARRKFWEMW